MAKTNDSARRKFEDFVAACQLAWAVITVPVVLASAATTVLRIDPSSGLVPMLGWIVRFYQDNFYAPLQALPAINLIPNWMFDILLVGLILFSLAATYSVRIRAERSRLDAYIRDGDRAHLRARGDDISGVDLAVAATATGAIITAGVATGVLDALGAAMGVPFVGTLLIGAIALFRSGEKDKDHTDQEAELRRQRRTIADSEMTSFRKRERAVFIVATTLVAALVAVNFALRGVASAAPAPAHAMCVTHHAPGEQCSCERAPTTIGVSTPARSGLRNVCMIQQ